MPFPARAGTTFTFDAPTFSVYGQLAAWWGHANAATVFAGLPSWPESRSPVSRYVAPSRRSPWGGHDRRPAPQRCRGLRRRSQDGPRHSRAAGGRPAGLARPQRPRAADYLQLPGGSPTSAGCSKPGIGTSADRFISVPGATGSRPPGRQSGATVGSSSTAPVRPRRSSSSTTTRARSRLDGEVVARPRDGLTAYRLPAEPRVRGLAVGLTFDRWAETLVSYRVWPRRPTNSGAYHVTVALPASSRERRVTFTVDGAAPRTLCSPAMLRKRSRSRFAATPFPRCESRPTRPIRSTRERRTPVSSPSASRLSYRTND